jgi:glutamine phosphoribosylpyrophosphate amidotransferase
MNINTPLRAQLSRYYQRLGGDTARGSATATANEFSLKGSGAASLVKMIDEQLASCRNPPGIRDAQELRRRGP